jgi:putative hydrolase of the HAD superfamily
MTVRAVAFDFGGPVLRTPFELLGPAEQRLQVPPGTLDWRGPFDPSADPLWRRMTAGEMSERDYWTARADEFSAVAGVGSDLRDLFGFLFDAPMHTLIRPVAEEFALAAREAGLQTSVLTNDLARFHPADWIDDIPFLQQVGPVVDGSLTGVLKPDPGAYHLLLATLRLPADQVLFIDDQLRNVESARQVGLVTVLFDPTEPSESYRLAYRLAGLTPPHGLR